MPAFMFTPPSNNVLEQRRCRSVARALTGITPNCLARGVTWPKGVLRVTPAFSVLVLLPAPCLGSGDVANADLILVPLTRREDFRCRLPMQIVFGS